MTMTGKLALRHLARRPGRTALTVFGVSSAVFLFVCIESLSAGLDAALAINEGSAPPNYYSGPLWAIFDQDTVERTNWQLRFPYVADNGYYFTADTIEALAAKIEAGHEFVLHARVVFPVRVPAGARQAELVPEDRDEA